MLKKIFNRRTGTRTLYLVLVLVGIVIALLLNIVAGALCSRYPLSVDLTKARVFRLEQATRDYLATLNQPISIQVLATQEKFDANSDYNAQADAILQQFARSSDQITLSYINFAKDPTFAAKYAQYTLKEGDLLVSSGSKVRHIATQDLFNYTQDASGSYVIASSKAEQTVLSAVLYVVSTEMPKIAVISGHGENTPAAFATLLEDNNFELSGVQLATEDLSADTDVALICAPQNDFTADELAKLDAFLQNGGKYGKTVFYTAAADLPALPNLEAFLEEWGVAVGDGAVFETDDKRVYNYHPFYAVADYVDETYSALLRSTDVPFLAPVSKPLKVLYETRDNHSTSVLLQFGKSSGVRPSDADKSFTADDAVWKGPIPALVLCSNKLRDSQNANVIDAQSNVVVSGSTTMLESYAVNNTSFANADYLVKLLNQLCARKDTVTVTPKQLSDSALNLTEGKANLLGALFVFVIPAVVLVYGLVLWLARRHK